MTTTAKIAAKGTSGTGITEDLAKRCHDQLGRKILAVVELVAESRSEKRNGDESVTLSILTLEPAPNTDTEDHLRELARSFHYERALAAPGGQQAMDFGESDEPKVADVLAAGAKYKPHPFIAVDAAAENPICDVCGEINPRPQHADREQLADPFTVDVTEEDLDAADEDEDLDDEDPMDVDDEDPMDVDDGSDDLVEVDVYQYTHAKGGNGEPGVETPCGLRATFGASLHTHTDDAKVDCPDCLTALHGDGQEPEDVDPYDEPHEFEAGPDDSCICGAPYGNPIHLDVDQDDDAQELEDAAMDG